VPSKSTEHHKTGMKPEEIEEEPMVTAESTRAVATGDGESVEVKRHEQIFFFFFFAFFYCSVLEGGAEETAKIRQKHIFFYRSEPSQLSRSR
jgi:hypothetical protein